MELALRVVHCKKEKYDVYIGRPSKWGNPFVIGKDGDRLEVIQKYKNWLLNNPELLKDIHELQDKVLGCWCHPKICHGDVLVELLSDFKPDYAVPPGATIEESLNEKNIPQEKFAETLGLDLTDFVKFLVGDLPLTEEMAKILSKELGGSEAFWNRREFIYREDLERLKGKS
jgi:plasmid maintenance system antidote protein VapI